MCISVTYLLRKMTEWYRMKTGFNSKNDSSELSAETSCEMSDSFNAFSDNLSPIPPSMVPRKLDFTNMDDDEELKDGSQPPVSLSPPYKRVRALRYVSRFFYGISRESKYHASPFHGVRTSSLAL